MLAELMRNMKFKLPTHHPIAVGLLAFCLIPVAWAVEATGRAGQKEGRELEIESEFYAGERGYLHGGLGVTGEINDHQAFGVIGHFVREDSHDEIFPSFGGEFIQRLENGFELEFFTFGYVPMEEQYAWAFGMRGSREFEIRDSVSLIPFFGPTFARVRTIDEATLDPTMISHLMLLGGVALEAGPVTGNLFGSYSFYNRDPRGLETHVDLEEMTHLAAYENNDGFARSTVGTEISYAIHDRVALNARYALILYHDQTRHSISFTPEFVVNERTKIFAGFQLLRGDGEDNNLLVTGASFSFE